MGNVAANVTTGKPNVSGAVFYGKINTATLPTDATTALSGFTCLGYISDAGLENNNTDDFSTIRAWGTDVVYRSITESTDEFKFAMIESENENVLKAVYGENNVSVNGTDISVNVKAEDPTEYIWVFELSLRGGKAKRIVVPDGAITAREAITYNDSDPVAYNVTVTAYADSNKCTHYEYIEDAPSPSI